MGFNSAFKGLMIVDLCWITMFPFEDIPHNTVHAPLCTLIKSVLALLQISNPLVFPVFSKTLSEY